MEYLHSCFTRVCARLLASVLHVSNAINLVGGVGGGAFIIMFIGGRRGLSRSMKKCLNKLS